MNILYVALAPVLIIAVYIHYRDKYEKEPLNMLIKAMLFGCFITIPILFIEYFLDSFTEGFPIEISPLYSAFIVASLTEELFKYIAFFILIWNNRNFNEKFDGIIYAVFISLGFAAVENIFYVVQNGYGVGVLRALTAVPAHAIFGICMGFYFGMAKFDYSNRSLRLFFAFFVPFLLHGIYDTILMYNNGYLLLLFIPFIILMWYKGFKFIKKHSEDSPFKINNDTVA
jgi:RsiW-degrading membrane proteinase PrsW (M82 family)